jgi:hypothetical protein
MDKYAWKFNGRRNVHGEYVVRCWKNDVRHPEGDYFTTDKQDAESTLAHLTSQC